MPFTPPVPIAPYYGWTEFTPVVPDLYWNVYSAEERIKKLCMEYAKLCEYANLLGTGINADHQIIQELEVSFTKLIEQGYTPHFADPIEWSEESEYAPLTIVTHRGNSYTSRQYVPAGTSIYDTEYWIETGNYDTQVEAYREDVLALTEKVTEIDALIPTSDFTEENTVKKYIDDSVDNIEQIINNASYAIFNTINEMVEDTKTSWIYALVLNANDYPYCIGEKQMLFKRVNSENCTYFGDDKVLISLDDGTKADPTCFGNVPNPSNPINNLISAASYVNRDDFAYHASSGAFLPTTKIDDDYVSQCSSFVYSYMKDVPFNNSRYVNSENIIGQFAVPTPDVNSGNYDNYDGTVGIAAAALANGYAFVPETIEDLTIGDICIYSVDTATYDNTWLHAGHCNIVVGIDKKNNALTVLECGGSPLNRINASFSNGPRISKYTYSNAGSDRRGIVLVARFPFGGISSFEKLSDIHCKPTSPITLSHSQRLAFTPRYKLENNKIYKITLTKDAPDPFYVSVSDGNNLFAGAFDGCACTFFVVSSNNDAANAIYINLYSDRSDNTSTLSISEVNITIESIEGKLSSKYSPFTALNDYTFLSGICEVENGTYRITKRFSPSEAVPANTDIFKVSSCIQSLAYIDIPNLKINIPTTNVEKQYIIAKHSLDFTVATNEIYTGSTNYNILIEVPSYMLATYDVVD